MAFISKGRAWQNGEVAYLAWEVDQKIPDCLGFMVTRVHETGADAGQRRILPTWIAFTDQSNPEWEEQDSSVWPIQSFNWRDLTLRKSRNTTAVRPIDFRVHYEITPVGSVDHGRGAVAPSETAPFRDPVTGKARYEGAPRPLFVLDAPFVTDPIDVTHKAGADCPIEATFTNGILSTQNLLKQLEAAAPARPALDTRSTDSLKTTQGLLKVLTDQIQTAGSPIRTFLTGDVLSFLRRMLERAAEEGGEVFLALYELHDRELITLLKDGVQHGRVHLILSATSETDPNPGKNPPVPKLPTVWDTENDRARADIHAIDPGAIQDRMLTANSDGPIGHDKFAVYVKDGVAKAVMTGSTNWTETGLCTQSNNTIIIEDDKVATAYLAFWNRLHADVLPARVPLTVQTSRRPVVGAEGSKAIQGSGLRSANAQPSGPFTLKDGKTTVQLWCSPNTASSHRPANPPMPPDLNDVYWLMDHAKEAILFLTFLPGQSGNQNIIGEAAKLATARPELVVLGAMSDPSAMPGFRRPKPGEPDPDAFTKPDGKPGHLPPPAIWWPNGEQSRIAFIRAAAVRIPIGNLRPELLTAGHAIIHDKIIVIDPLDETGCTVITGSHNLGYKASYTNDENLLIIKGNRELAISYAVHVLDVYDHYVMRARLEEQYRQALKAHGKADPDSGHGFLKTDQTWQDRFFPRPASAMDYFLRHI